jgi:predicted O-linked N-acetylglucosamine transferase (SPINDLY family)
MRILKAVSGSVLWLLEDNPMAAKNLRKEAELRGVDASRIVFAKRMKMADHLARHRVADLFIDTLPCNAGTTASDALWAGLPVLTLLGKSFAGRIAASLLNGMNMPELIAKNQEEYEFKAIEFANNPSLLFYTKEKTTRNRLESSLYNTKLLTTHLEAGYEEMYRRYVAGEVPANIYVSP